MNAIKEFSFILWIKFVAFSFSLTHTPSPFRAPSNPALASICVPFLVAVRSMAIAFIRRAAPASWSGSIAFTSTKEAIEKGLRAPFAHLLCNSNESLWHILWQQQATTPATAVSAAAMKTKTIKTKQNHYTRHGRRVYACECGCAGVWRGRERERRRLKISKSAEAL